MTTDRDRFASGVVIEQGLCGYITEPGVVCIREPHGHWGLGPERRADGSPLHRCEALREPRGNVMGQQPCDRYALDYQTGYMGEAYWLCWQHSKMARKPDGYVTVET